MRVASCTQMSEIDNAAINVLGIPGIVLMENAAIKVVGVISKQFKGVSARKIIIFCGTGNNGGDGFAIARHLSCMNADIIVGIVGDRDKIRGDALVNLNIIEKMGIKILLVEKDDEFDYIKSLITNTCDIVVDAIFGTGLKGVINGRAEEIIKLVNFSKKYIVSVDIPSGINGDTGEICGICVKANKTVVFVMPKLGLLNYPAADYVGEIIVEGISIPEALIEAENININTVEERYITSIMPIRKDNSNKGDYGKIFIIAGSTGMAGAAVLASLSALNSGSGLVKVGVPQTINSIVQMKLTEVITIPLADEGNGVLAYSSMDKIIQTMEKADVLVVGPGLSINGDIRAILEEILKKSKNPVIIDADGINALAENINILRDCKCQIILTPHPGEMSRLTNLSVEAIQADRVKIARDFAMNWGLTLVLKGAHTVIACADGRIYINLNGNAGMATAGMGDVLAGVISSLVGQGLSPEQAAIAGVFIHGFAGDTVAKRKGQYGLTAMDVLKALPKALKLLGGK